MKIGSKIKDLRIKNNMTQEELANKLYVTRNAVSKWENNKGIPNIDSLKELAKIFSVTLDYLVDGEEIKKLAIDNKNILDFSRDLLFSIILFIVFILIGTMIPYISLMYDPTAALPVFLIVLPVTYAILGVLSVIFKMKWPYVIISSALAITPIYIFFDISDHNMVISYIWLIYYALYIGAYFIMAKIITFSTKNNNHFKVKKLLLYVAIVITLVFLIHTLIEVIITLNCILCSASWYTPLVINLFIYIVPLTASYTLYFYFKNLIKKEHLSS